MDVEQYLPAQFKPAVLPANSSLMGSATPRSSASVRSKTASGVCASPLTPARSCHRPVKEARPGGLGPQHEPPKRSPLHLDVEIQRLGGGLARSAHGAAQLSSPHPRRLTKETSSSSSESSDRWHLPCGSLSVKLAPPPLQLAPAEDLAAQHGRGRIAHSDSPDNPPSRRRRRRPDQEPLAGCQRPSLHGDVQRQLPSPRHDGSNPRPRALFLHRSAAVTPSGSGTPSAQVACLWAWSKVG